MSSTPPDDQYGNDLGASLRHHVAADPHQPDLLAGSLQRAKGIRRRRIASGAVGAVAAAALIVAGGAIALQLPGRNAAPPPIAGTTATAGPTPTSPPSATATTPYEVTVAQSLPKGAPPDVEWYLATGRNGAGTWHDPAGNTVQVVTPGGQQIGGAGSVSMISTEAGMFAPRFGSNDTYGYSLGDGSMVTLGKGGTEKLGDPFAYNGGVVWPLAPTKGSVYVDARGRQHDWPAFPDNWQATAGTTRYLWGTQNGKVGRFNPDTLTDSQLVAGYTDVVAGDPVSNIVALRASNGCLDLLDAQSLDVVVHNTCTGFLAVSADGRYYAGVSRDASSGTTVEVIDLTTGKTVASVHGVALPPGRDAVFDAADRLVTIAMPSGDNPVTALVTVDFLHNAASVNTNWINAQKATFHLLVPNNQPGATASHSESSTTAPASPSSSPATDSTPPNRQLAACTAADTEVAVTPAKGGGAAGSYFYDVTVTNTSSTACTVHGFPGVSMVTGDSGKQLGAAADRQGRATTRVVVKPKGHASAVLQVADAGNYGDSCKLAPARGFRVYLPGEKAAQFAKADVRGCANDTIKLLTIHPFGA